MMAELTFSLADFRLAEIRMEFGCVKFFLPAEKGSEEYVGFSGHRRGCGPPSSRDFRTRLN